MTRAAATIASRSHLGLAHCMARSFLAHHPGEHVVVLLVDGPSRVAALDDLGVTTVLATDLDIPDLAGMRARYTTYEFCNALKPHLLEHLLGAGGYERALYLDSDLYIVDTLVPDALTPLDDAAVLLTPHLISAPGFGADVVTQELALLLRGSLNGGFVGARSSPHSTQFLRWWSDRVTLAGYHRLDRGMNCDQRWLDLVPGLDIDVHIAKHPGLNVAYWNLHERRISQREGRWYCNEKPLRFVHFSGFAVDDPTALTRHWSRFNLVNRPDIAGLAEEYRAALRASLALMAERRPLPAGPRHPTYRPVSSARQHGTPVPDASVVVPVHNGARFLAEAVESALAQRGVALEVVVVDDGSTDDPASVLPADARVSLLTTSHAGVSSARNHGLARARGRIVIFLDADDAISDPLRVRDQLALLDDQPELAIVHSGWEIVDENGGSIVTRTPWKRLPDLTLERWIDDPSVLPSAMAFRRESLLEIGGFDSSLPQLEDLDLVLRLLLRGWQARWIERVTTRYRRHRANASADVDAQAKAHAAVLDRLFSEPDLPAAVSRQQRRIRYNTHVWLASRYHESGRPAAMADHLAASAVFADSQLGLLPLDWIGRFADAATEAGDPPLEIASLTAEPAWIALTRLSAGALLERGMTMTGTASVPLSAPAAQPPPITGGIWRTAGLRSELPPPALDLSAALARSYGRHRSGWSAALDTIRPLHTEHGVLVDGFVEHTFHEASIEPSRSPWIGFLHNPPETPPWYPIDQSATRLFADQRFRASLANCLGLFTLSSGMRDWWARRVDVPVECVPHPVAEPHLRFTMERLQLNPFPRIVQVGTWLRKLHAIHDLPVRGLRRTIVHQHEPYIDLLFKAEREALNLQVDGSGVETLPYLDDREYDELLSCNLVFVELYSAGANNAIVECIARATPILVNPLPAVREYLGEEYPLYFSSRVEAARKAEDLDLVAKAHAYLANLPQATQLTGASFLEAVGRSAIYGSLTAGPRSAVEATR